MPFVIFCARSCKRSQHHFCVDFRVGIASCCITVEVEPRIANQYKCHHCCSCKNYRGKGMEGEKKTVSALFLTDQKITSSWTVFCFGASYSTSNKLLLIARHILTTGLRNLQIHCHRLPLRKKYTPEVKAAKGLKRCWAKVKGVNNPA